MYKAIDVMSFVKRKSLHLGLIVILALAIDHVVSPVEKVNSVENINGSSTVTKDIQSIHDFIAAFNAKDVDTVMNFFSEDAIYHNMPSGPVQGTEAVRNLITSFVNPASSINWETLNIAQTGDTVLTERIDRFVINGKNIELPVMGAFDMKNGKITAWRDYFDMATWQKQMAN